MGRRLAVGAFALLIAAALGVLARERLRVDFPFLQRHHREFLELSWPSYADGLRHRGHSCVSVNPTIESVGLLHGYCQLTVNGTGTDIAAYGEGAKALTYVNAIAHGALKSREYNEWLRSLGELFPGEEHQEKVERWLHERFTHGGGTKTFVGLQVRVSTVIGGHYLRVEISSRANQPPDKNAPVLAGIPFGSLAARYAPRLRFTKGESFYPLSIRAYESQASLCRMSIVKGEPDPTRVACVPSPDDENSLPSTQCAGAWSWCLKALDIKRADEAPPDDDYRRADANMRHIDPGVIVYWHAVPASTSRVVLQYWFLYSFNNFTNRHEGDWEHISLEIVADPLPGSTPGLPVVSRLYYSAHEEGHRKRVPHDLGAFDARWRPTVYVAERSHANYFGVKGRHEAAACKQLIIEACLVQRDKARGNGRVVLPPGVGSATCRYSLLPLGGPAPTWRYGPANVTFVDRRKVRGLAPNDPRARKEWDEIPLDVFDKSRDEGRLTPADVIEDVCR